MTDSVRHLQTFEDTMKRYHGEIERLVYAAETMCIRKHCRECPFYNELYGKFCDVMELRKVIGEHVEQHDPGAVPPCRCGGECNCNEEQK